MKILITGARSGIGFQVGIKLARLRLHETETSYAEWLIEDNE